MSAGSVTIVLPAFNEEARLESALDELFGYLRRRGEQARDGAPGAVRRVLRVRGGVGEATVHLPREIGISATASGGIGDISVTGLRKSGDRYVNDAYERAAVRIRLDVQGGVGSIKLIAE